MSGSYPFMACCTAEIASQYGLYRSAGQRQLVQSDLIIPYKASYSVPDLRFSKPSLITPVHIEMRKYEEDMNKAIIKDADREETIRK